MSKNIYEMLGFKQSKKPVFSAESLNEARGIFNKIPLKLVSLRPLIVEQSVFEETLAISTAEDSKLTPAQAKKIEVSGEQEARLIKYKNDSKLTPTEKYDRLEFENIRALENKINNVSFADITLSLVRDIHHDLTIGLDDYCREKGVSHYHSGQLRETDTIKVGKVRAYTPPAHNQIPDLLKCLFRDFANRKTINLCDIVEFHVLFYAIHPFRNGNKRVARILESMLVQNYGYGADRTLSLSTYYSDKKDAFTFFLMESILKKDPTPFINFALRGYFYVGKQLLQKTLALYLNTFRHNFKAYIEDHITPLKLPNYQIASKSIIDLNGVFTHTEFILTMKTHHSTVGIAQSIIEDLADRQILKKSNRLYYYGDCLNLRELIKETTKLTLRYNVEGE